MEGITIDRRIVYLGKDDGTAPNVWDGDLVSGATALMTLHDGERIIYSKRFQGGWFTEPSLAFVTNFGNFAALRINQRHGRVLNTGKHHIKLSKNPLDNQEWLMHDNCGLIAFLKSEMAKGPVNVLMEEKVEVKEEVKEAGAADVDVYDQHERAIINTIETALDQARRYVRENVLDKKRAIKLKGLIEKMNHMLTSEL